MKIGYVRVSTENQNPDLQLDAHKATDCEKIFIDKARKTGAAAILIMAIWAVILAGMPKSSAMDGSLEK